jgi:hypothetical protein
VSHTECSVIVSLHTLVVENPPSFPTFSSVELLGPVRLSRASRRHMFKTLNPNSLRGVEDFSKSRRLEESSSEMGTLGTSTQIYI